MMVKKKKIADDMMAVCVRVCVQKLTEHFKKGLIIVSAKWNDQKFDFDFQIEKK